MRRDVFGTREYDSISHGKPRNTGRARLRVNGRTRAIPPSDGPVGYAISRGGKITGLEPAQRPVCRA